MSRFARLLVLLPLLWVEGVWAVDCADTNYRLRTQDMVDSLGATGCNTILGSLTIESGANITNINGLANLTSVGGSLLIDENSALTNIDGLVNLTSVGDVLFIRNNDGLTNVAGLASLTSVGSDLNLYHNDALTNINGLANLTSVGGYLNISDNTALTNIHGLAKLASVGSAVSIGNNSALTDIDGLESLINAVGYLFVYRNSALSNLNGLANLTSVGNELYLTQNDALQNVDGLANLTSVGGFLYLEQNDALTNVDGLAKLASVGGWLSIDQNNALTNIDGLASLTSVGEYLWILGNSALKTISGLANLTSVGGSVGISDNNVLGNIDGLASLTSIENYLLIRSNGALTNIDGLANLTSIGGDLEVVSNNSLADCQGLALVLGWPSGPPEDDVVGDIEVSNGTGCSSVQQVLDSISDPTQPVINQVAISSTSISLAFMPSSATITAFPVTGYTASCTGADIDVSASPASNLPDNTPVQEKLTVSGYDPTSVLAAIEVEIDITHSDPTDLYITLTTPEGTELILWNQGSSGGENLVGTFPSTLTAVDSLDSVTRQTMDGDWVLSIEDIDVGPLVREGVLNSWGIRITEELARNGSGSPIEVFGATRGRDYTCTVAPVTKLGTTPVSDPYTVSVPLELPSVPTITSTDYEDGKIILTVSVSDNGGTDITGYDATCTDGTNTYTGTSTSSPITVSGLTNDVAYTCTVTATNSVGTSSASAATAPITPEAASTGLPIWLLYQATQ